MTAPVDEAPEPSPAPAPATGAPATPEPATASEAPATAEQAPAAGTASPPASDQRLLSPVVRRLVNEHGIDPAQIQGTGPGGRITREDVLDHIDRNGGQGAPAAPSAPSPAPAAEPAPAAAPVPAAAPAASEARREPDAPRSTSPRSTRSVKLTKIRKLTGDHMVMSKATSPHAFSVVEIDFANVDGTRARIKQEWKSHEGFSLTYLPFISRAIVDAIAEFPHMNATVTEDELVIHDYVDLGIAVDLQYEGLLAPVVRNAETKRLRAIAREISDLASRAKARKLSPDEIQGGTFTISNNGSAGSVLTMPIINQPQVAIISTDAIVRKPVVVEGPDGGEAIAIHPVGNLAMSWDHRAFDGAYAAGFLKRVKEILETRDWSAEL
jgi:pyruvate dehydrogenase E2 component (dihydrolipoamide acetyltransferase)